MEINLSVFLINAKKMKMKMKFFSLKLSYFDIYLIHT